MPNRSRWRRSQSDPWSMKTSGIITTGRTEYRLCRTRHVKNYVIRSQPLLNNLGHPEKHDVLWFVLKLKKFRPRSKGEEEQGQRPLCKLSRERPKTLMLTKIPLSVIFGSMSNEVYVMTPHFYPRGGQWQCSERDAGCGCQALVSWSGRGNGGDFMRSTTTTLLLTPTTLPKGAGLIIFMIMWSLSSGLLALQIWFYRTIVSTTSLTGRSNSGFPVWKSCWGSPSWTLWRTSIGIFWLRYCTRSRSRIKSVIEAEGGYI